MKHQALRITLMSSVMAVMLAGCSASQLIETKLNRMPHKAMLIDEVHDRGINLDTLESVYPSGMVRFGDSVPQAYMQAWTSFVQGLAGAMRQAGMDWSEPYRLWGRAYFSPEGKVDHYFYAWTGATQPADEWKAQFRQVLEDYLSTFRFAYPMGGRFAQCGGIALRPAN